MTLNEIQIQKIIEFIKNEYEKEEQRFSEEYNEHQKKGDFEEWLILESEKENIDIDNLILQVQLELNISNCDDQVREIFKKYIIQRNAHLEMSLTNRKRGK